MTYAAKSAEEMISKSIEGNGEKAFTLHTVTTCTLGGEE